MAHSIAKNTCSGANLWIIFFSFVVFNIKIVHCISLMILWKDTAPLSYFKIFAPELKLGRDNSQIVYSVAPVYMLMCNPQETCKKETTQQSKVPEPFTWIIADRRCGMVKMWHFLNLSKTNSKKQARRHDMASQSDDMASNVTRHTTGLQTPINMTPG